MILVDTSVWIDHLRRGDAHLMATLLAGHWGGENIFYKNDPAFNPCIDCFLFTYQKL